MDKPKLIGVVMCGGKSSRMGVEKCMLDYFGAPQWEIVQSQLEEYCDEVVISCREDQRQMFPESSNVITDDKDYSDIGPLAALMTIHNKYPDANLFLLGCDYPLVTSTLLDEFIKQFKDPFRSLAIYHNDDDFFETLITIYSKDVFDKMEVEFMESLQIILHSSDVQLAEVDVESVVSVDTPEMYLAVKQAIQDEFIRHEQMTPDLFM